MTAQTHNSRSKFAAAFVAAAIAFTTTLLTAPSASAELVPPVITSPLSGTEFCDRPGTDFTMTGTANAGSPLQFVADDLLVGEPTTPAEDGSFTIPVDRPAGAHVLKVQQPDGETLVSSEPVNVTIFGVDSVIGSTTTMPATISPDGDGQYETTTFSVPVLRAGQVSFVVKQGNKTVAYSPTITKSGPGTASWTWNGKGSSAYNGGVVVGSGTYTVRTNWLGADSCVFTGISEITVDNVDPAFGSYNETPDTFYPREDDDLTEYKDDITFSWKGLTEETFVRVEIFKKGAAPLLKSLTYGWDTGDGSLRWNGRKSDGSMYAAGSYEWLILMTDRVHNVKRSGKRSFTISGKRIDEQATSVARNGNDYTLGSASGCGFGADDLSYWSTGVWISVLDCNDDAFTLDASMADYAFQMPSAPYYDKLEMKVYGMSELGNDPIFGLLDNVKTGMPDAIGFASTTTPALKVLGSFTNPYDYIDAQKKVHGHLLLLSPCDCEDVEFDVRTVYVRVTYGVLVA